MVLVSAMVTNWQPYIIRIGAERGDCAIKKPSISCVPKWRDWLCEGNEEFIFDENAWGVDYISWMLQQLMSHPNVSLMAMIILLGFHWKFVKVRRDRFLKPKKLWGFKIKKIFICKLIQKGLHRIWYQEEECFPKRFEAIRICFIQDGNANLQDVYRFIIGGSKFRRGI